MCGQSIAIDIMRVTDVRGGNHLVYQFQLILCLQGVVTHRVTTLFTGKTLKTVDDSLITG